MARPLLPATEQRTLPVRTYWTDAEYAQLLRQAKAARLPVSAYIRSVVLGERVEQKAS